MTGSGRAPASLDVYLQPAVVGGGLGDIEEVLAVGRRLGRAGHRLLLYRTDGRPLPASVEGPWGWPRVQRTDRIRPRSRHAMTVTPWWGVSAVPDPERTGPPGPWSSESADIERAYGRERVVHLSLEEFARTLTSRQQTRERWREGGVAHREIARRERVPATEPEVVTFRTAYRKWRAFDRANVLHLFTGFRPSRAFGREFPEAVQAGPLWPEPAPRRRRQPGRPRWVWYASPSTSNRLAVKLAEAVPAPSPGVPPLAVEVRGPRRFDLPRTENILWQWVEPTSPEDWSRRFRDADLRVVTGSRTLLEALRVGGPFLYFNGVLNRGARTRRHRPEKIAGLLAAWRRHAVPPSLRRDLADFSRLRRIPSIVRRAVRDPKWSTTFPARAAAVDFRPPWDDAGQLIDRWAREWARTKESAAEFVRRWREWARSPRYRL